MEFRFEFEVKESHLDTFGHVNNATYLTLFEEARWDLITANGYGLRHIQKIQQGPIVLGVEVQFRRELLLREKVIIVSKVLNYEGRVSKMQQTMVKADGKDACIAVFSFGLFDMKVRKLIPPTEEWLRAIGLKDAPQK